MSGEIWFVCNIIMSYGSFSDLIKINFEGAMRNSNGSLEGDMNFFLSPPPPQKKKYFIYM